MLASLEDFRAWASRPWVSYLAALLLQLKVVWGIWARGDLTTGDTSSYFLLAELWRQETKVNLPWSPLYTAFYGTLGHLSPGDAYAPTILHRLVLVLAVTTLVLAVLRRLVPPDLALLLTAWWAILPTAFATAFEVHLFATLPVLLAWLVILGPPSARRRGAAVAILAAGMVLVRNELGVAALLLAAGCLVAEVRSRRALPTAARPPAAFYVKAYGLPLAAAALVCGAVYTRAMVKLPELWTLSAPKHTVNMCQVYAYGHKQRHPEWTLDHWTQCAPLMAEHFGERQPTLGAMIRKNPGAVLEHFRWNAGLTGNGLQVTLFNATSGSVTPDYGAVRVRSTKATVASAVALLIVLGGVVALLRRPQHWWRSWLRERRWGWVAIACLVPVWGAVILTQRPRPSYLLTLGVACLALLGTGLAVTVWRAPNGRVTRYRPVAVLAAVSALIVSYPSAYDTVPPRERPLLDLYRRLKPYERLIAQPDTVFLVSRFSFEVAHYLGRGRPRVLDYGALEPLRSWKDLAAFLDGAKVNLFYADETLLTHMHGEFGGTSPPGTAAAWTLVGSEDHPWSRWQLWRRRQAVYQDLRESASPAPVDVVGPVGSRTPGEPSEAGIALGSGWYAPETWKHLVFRWASNDAEVVLDRRPHGRRLRMDIEPGPSAQALPLPLLVLDERDAALQRVEIGGRGWITVEVPGGTTVLKLHTDGGGRRILPDPRTLNFRVFALQWADGG